MFRLIGKSGTRAGFRDARLIAAPESEPIRALMEYWQSKRGARFAPRRADIDPADIKTHMPNLMMVDVLPDGDFRYRLIGTAFTDGMGRNATGRRLTEVFAEEPGVIRLFKERFATVIEMRQPLYSAGKVYWEADPDEMRLFECGYFPLSDDGEQVNIILYELQMYWPR